MSETWLALVAFAAAALSLAGLVLLRRGRRATPADRRALLTLLLAPLPPLVLNALYSLGAWPLPADPTPIGFALSVALAGALLLRRQLLRREPIHSHTLLEQLPDALCVLGAGGQLLEANAAGERLWQRTPGAAEALAVALPSLRQLPPGGSCRRWLELAGRRYELSGRALPAPSDAEASYLLSLRDVSAQAQATERLERQTEFQAALIECLGTLLEEDAQGIYQRVLEQAIATIPGAAAGSILRREGDGSFRFVASVGFDLALLQTLRLEPHEIYCGDLANEPVLERNLAARNRALLPPEKQAIIARAGGGGQGGASLAVPVRLEGELLAVLSLDNPHDAAAFDGEARRLAEVFAKHVGAALQKARLMGQLERAAAERDLLARVERLLLETDSLRHFFPLLGELLLTAPVLGVDQLLLYERQPGRGLKALVHARDPRRDAAVAEALANAGLLTAWGQQDNVLHACTEARRPLYLSDTWEAPGWLRLEANPSRSVLLCPLAHQGEVWAVLEFAADAPRAFDEEARELLVQIAHSAELALSRQQERARLELEVARMNTVVATGEHMRHLGSRQAVHEAAVVAVLERTRAVMGTLLWHQPASADEPERLLAVASRRADGQPSFLGRSIARGEGLAWAALDGGATVRASEPEALERVVTCGGRHPVSDYIGTPLRGPDNRPVGVLVASQNAEQSFDESDVAFLEAIAQATSSALTRLALLEAAEAEAEAYESLYRTSLRQAQELELLDRVRTAVARELELDEVIRTLVTAVSETFGYAQVSLYWLEGERLVPRYYVGYERAIPSLDLGRGVMARALRSGAPILVEDVTQDPDFVAGAPGTTSEIAVPIRGRGQLVGVLNVETGEGMRLDEADLKLMVSLGEQVGLAVERALWHAEVQRSEERFRLLAETVSDLVCLHDPDGTLRYVSPSSTALLGTPPEALMGQPLTAVVHPDDWPGIKRRMVGLLRAGAAPDPFVLRLKRMDGSYGAFETVIQPLLDERGRLQGFTSSSRDVTERQRMEARLRYAANCDALTGLVNRAHFLERLEAALAKGRALAVLFVDLDRFKVVNDSLGHEVGDALLKMISARLRDQVREDDTVARLGGDEFCVLLERLESEAEAVRISERLLAALAEPFALEGREVFVGASIGIAYGEPGAVRADELLRNADIAMYRAKHGGRGGYVVFDRAMHQEALSRLTLETDLRRALERGELSLVYQPIFALAGGEPIGFEALCRWQRNGVPVPPDQFIALAEETGLITELDAWVLETASAQLAAWRRGGADWGISVNLASRSFEQPDLPERLRGLLAASGLPARCLTLEITERTVMDRGGGAKLSALRALGVRVEVDDFGTGYSSLRYLHELPLDSLKIDRSFVAQLGGDQPGAVVRSILALADQLGLQVVAEGIETEEQLERLRALGCAFGQGYLLARPLPPAEVERRFLTCAHPAPLELALYASGDQLASGD